MGFVVSFTPRAQKDLDSIWQWNAQAYDEAHAEEYTSFLIEGAVNLGDTHALARPVPNAPEYRYATLRKGSGAGHVVVFQITDETVEILRYFHTAQNWQEIGVCDQR